MGFRLTGAKFIGIDGNGDPLAAGKLHVYLAGTTTETDSYSDNAITTPHTNPVILDARGEETIFLDPAISYKLVLKDSGDTTIWTQDNFSITTPDLSAAETVSGIWDFTAIPTYNSVAMPVVAFKTIDCPAGTDPVADLGIDTLVLATGDATLLTITGDSSTDTITFALTALVPDTSAAETIAGAWTFTGAVVVDSITFNEAAFTGEDVTAIATNVLTLDCSQSNSFSVELDANITTFTVNNLTAGQGITVLLSQDATGSRTVAFPAGWVWSGGSAPTVSSGANEEDILSLIKFGTTIYANMMQNFS